MEFDFDVCVDSRQYLTNTSKLNLTLGTFNGKSPEGFYLNNSYLLQLGNVETISGQLVTTNDFQGNIFTFQTFFQKTST